MMATISSHILNAVDGTHAGGIEATLYRVSDRTQLASTSTDGGGRLKIEVDITRADPTDLYELVFQTGAYWADSNAPRTIPEVLLRFTMPDPDGAYHMPIILSPLGFSTWSSG